MTTTREQDSRQSLGRQDKYRPHQILETPPCPPGMKYRWVRHSLKGEDQYENVSNAMMEGWEPVSYKDLKPEVARLYQSMGDGRLAGTVKHKDVILMIAPEEVVRRRKEYYDGLSDKQAARVEKERKGFYAGEGIEFTDESKVETSVEPPKTEQKSRRPIFS